MEERQTACALQNGSSVINYTYNADGVRIGKSGAKTAAYTVCGTQILSENNGTNPGNLTPRAKDKNTGLSLLYRL